MYQAMSPAADADPVDRIMAEMPPGDGTEAAPHVFLSHAGEQKMSVVDVVRARFEDKHPQLGVFADEWSLQPGDRPMARMGAACWSAAVGVVLLSKEFVRKKYCMAELRILLQRCLAQGQQQQQATAQCQPAAHVAAAVITRGLAGLALGNDQGSRQLPVQLLPVLFELTVEQLRDIRVLYDTELWCVDEPKPSPAVLDAWAADLQQVAGFTLIRPDQWRGHSQLAEAIETRAVELLHAAGMLPPAPVPTMEVRSTVAPPEKVQLVGREQELDNALQALKEGRYVEICGGPGEGKTLLMQRLVAAVCDEWRQQPAAEAGGKVALALEVDLTLEDLKEMGLKDGKDLKHVVAALLLAQVHEPADKEQWQVLQGWLQRQAPAPVLIALENAEQCVAAPEDGMASVGRVFQELLDQLSRQAHVHLIIATRVRTPGISRALPAGSVVMLRQLEDAKGLKLLESRLGEGQLRGADGKIMAAAEQLVQLAQCNPMTLAVAAGLVMKGRTWEEILRCAQRDFAELNARSRLDPIGMKHYMAALRGWLEAFLAGPERQLLASVCVFPGSFTAPAAAAVSNANNTDAGAVGDILALLVDMSLLQRRIVSGVSDRQPELSVERYSMHALVRSAAVCSLDERAEQQSSQLLAQWMLVNSEGPGQALLRCEPTGVQPDTALRLYLLREELPNFAAAGAGLVASACDNGPTTRKWLHTALRYVRAKRTSKHQVKLVSALVDAAGDVGWQLSECGRGLAARQLQQCAVQLALRLLGPVHLDTLDAKNRLGVTLYRTGERREARRLAEEVLEARTRVLGPDHPDTLFTKGNLAIMLKSMGEPGKARRLEEEVLEARTRVLGPEHPDTLGAKGNLANTLGSMGELGQARQLVEEVLEAHTRVLGPEHPDTLSVKNNLACTLWRLWELGEARQLGCEMLAAHESVLGREHPDTANAKDTLGVILRDSGEVTEGRRLQEEALAVLQPILGAEHSSTLNIKHELGATLLLCGELAAARRLWEEVLQARVRVLGAQHPDTLKTRSALAGLG